MQTTFTTAKPKLARMQPEGRELDTAGLNKRTEKQRDYEYC